MFNRLLLSAVLSMPMILAGCSSNPMGMNDDEWKQLSPQAREQMLLEQQQINAERARVQQDADNRARELSLQIELEEKKRLQRLYKNPMQGNVVRVNLLKGVKHEGKTTWIIRPESFSIARSETKRIELQLRNQENGRTQTLPAYLHYREQGTGVELHLNREGSRDQLRFISDGQWDCGSDYNQQLKLGSQENIRIEAYIEELGAKPIYCKLRKRRK